MKRSFASALLVFLAAGLCLSACGPTKGPAAQPKPAMNGSRPKPVDLTPNPADVEFMSGMIPHHAQAVQMAGWAGSHGARTDVRILCERIVVGQRDEIKLMQQWLADRGQTVPDAASTRHRMVMNGMTHDMLMPGMLNDEEMAALDKARGPEWDRLFLLGMIKHHQGAIDMVNVLFGSSGGGQEETVYKFASDVFADQSIEIDRMQQMLIGKS
jgi:uncharacterized protein (DUF305 family)